MGLLAPVGPAGIGSGADWHFPLESDLGRPVAGKDEEALRTGSGHSMLSSAAWEPGVQKGAGPQEYPRWLWPSRTPALEETDTGGGKGKHLLEPWSSHLSMGLMIVVSLRRRQCE